MSERAESVVPVDDAGKCVVLVPVGGAIERDTDAALRQLEKQGYEVRRVWGYSAIDTARNEIAAEALNDGFDELMWIDADVVFHPRAVERLRRLQVPMSCGVYPKKGPREMAATFPARAEPLRFGRDGETTDVLQVGMGFVHTRREVYERVVEVCGLPLCNEQWGKPYYPFFLPMIKEEVVGGVVRRQYCGEDYAFCERVRTAGYTITADLRIRLWHVGSYRYGWEDAGRDVERFAQYTYSMGDRGGTA